MLHRVLHAAVTGGCTINLAGAPALSSCEAWSALTGQWRPMPSMVQPRKEHAMVTVGGHLLVCGGGKRDCSELYEFERGMWRQTPGGLAMNNRYHTMIVPS